MGDGRRRDAAILAAAVLGALAIQVAHALSYRLGYDETWHVFYGEAPGRIFWEEVRRDTHPPLSYLVLRGLLALDGHALTARLSSILPAVASLPLFFFLLRRAGLARAVAHLATWGLALSPSYTAVAVQVRSYMLAQLGMLVGLWGLARTTEARRAGNPLGPALALGLGSAAAAFSHYAYVFPLVAAAILLAVFGVCSRTGRARLRCALGRVDVLAGGAVAAVGTAGAFAWYRWSLPRRPRAYLPEHFPRPGEDFLAFTARAVGDEFGLLLPFHPGHGPAALVLAAALGAALVALAIRLVRRGNHAGRAALVLLAPAVAGMLWILALAGRYPFGGELRHQAVLLPLGAAAFAVVGDVVWRRLPGPGVRRAAVAAALAALALQAGPGLLERPPDDLPVRPRWEDAVAGAEAMRAGAPIVVSEFGFVPFYGAARARRWTFSRRLGARCERFLVESDPRRPLLRDRASWFVPAPLSRSAAARLARWLEAENAPRMIVLALWPKHDPRPQDRDGLRRTLAGVGLRAGRIRRFAHGEAFEVLR